jgi:hypothetical protein
LFVAHRPPSAVKIVGHIAKVIGVKITLTDVEDLVFSAGSLTWKLPHTISEVQLTHTCPDDPPESAPLPGSGINDMQEYYPLVGIPEAERFRFYPLSAQTEDANISASNVAHPFICFGGGGSKANGLI